MQSCSSFETVVKVAVEVDVKVEIEFGVQFEFGVKFDFEHNFKVRQVDFPSTRSLQRMPFCSVAVQRANQTPEEEMQ